MLHINLLLPCDFLPMEEKETPRMRKRQEKKRPHISTNSKGPELNGSEEEDEWEYIDRDQLESANEPVRSILRTDAEESQPQNVTTAPEQYNWDRKQFQMASEVDTMEEHPEREEEELQEDTIQTEQVEEDLQLKLTLNQEERKNTEDKELTSDDK